MGVVSKQEILASFNVLLSCCAVALVDVFFFLLHIVNLQNITTVTRKSLLLLTKTKAANNAICLIKSICLFTRQ
jgi:hypothetical protein